MSNNLLFSIYNSIDGIIHSFDIHASDKVIIRGPSGCGKSSLARLIGGIQPTHEIDLSVKWHVVRKPSISYLSQDSWSLGAELADEITFYETGKDICHLRMAKASFCAGISDNPRTLVPNSPFDNFTPSSLSGGQLRRLSLARVLYIPSAVILLDEPTASLHQSSKDAVLHRLSTLFPAETIINISHDAYTSHYQFRVLEL